MHLCFADIARVLFWPRINSPSRIMFRVASPVDHTPPLSEAERLGSRKATHRVASPESVVDVHGPPAPTPPVSPLLLSPLDDVCSRLWCVHQAIGTCLGGQTRWDLDGIVVAACAFARDLLLPSDVDYESFAMRVAVCSCYTLAFKNGTDHMVPPSLLYPNSSFLTTTYHAMFFNLPTISEVESQPKRLHQSIAHVEGQLLARIWQRLYAHATLGPTGRLENLVASLVMRSARPNADDPIHKYMEFFEVTRRVAGFLNALVLVSESCDANLTDRFHRAQAGTAVEEALLLICAYAITNAVVECKIPVCVASYLTTIDAESNDVAIRILSVYLACHDRLKHANIRTFSKHPDADANKLVCPMVMKRALGMLQRRHRRVASPRLASPRLARVACKG